MPLSRSLRARAPRNAGPGEPAAAPEPGEAPRASAAVGAEAAPERPAPRHPSGREHALPAELALLAHLRLAAREAFERGAARLLEGLAHDVLGRELRLAPADVEALVARALTVFAERGPVAIDLSPADAAAVADRFGLPLRIDPALGPGDVVVRVRDGSFESPLAFRLAGVLAEAGVA